MECESRAGGFKWFSKKSLSSYMYLLPGVLAIYSKDCLEQGTAYEPHRLDNYAIQGGGVVWQKAMHGERLH